MQIVLGLRPGAERAVVLRHGLYQHRRLEGGAEPAGRVRRFDRLGGRARWTAPRVEFVDRRRPAISPPTIFPSGCPTASRSCRSTDFSIEPGERVLVTGPSGSGKTSLFRALGGVWPFGDGLDPRPARRRACWCCRSGLICRSARCAARWLIPGRRIRSRRKRSTTWSTRSGSAPCASSSTRPPIGRQAVGRREAAAVDRPRAVAKARLAVPRRGDQRARRGLGGGALSPVDRAAAGYGHRLDRPPLEPGAVPWPLLRAQARATPAATICRSPRRATSTTTSGT